VDYAELSRNRLLETIVENAPAAIALLRGPDFIFEVVNPAYAAIAPGIPMLGRRVADVFPDISHIVVPLLGNVLLTGEPFRVDDEPLAISRCPGAPLETGYFSFSYTRINDGQDPESHSILVLVLETTLQKRAEVQRLAAAAELERQWRVFDTALSNTPDFTYTFDLEGRFTYVNRALLSLWQIPLSEALGKNFFELNYPPDLAARLQRQIQEVIDTCQPVRDQTLFTGPAGECRHYEYIFVPVRGATCQVEAVTGSTRDITERITAEERERARQEQALESARLESLGLMAGGIAHDFNNILTGVLGNASLLAETAPELDRPIVSEIVLAAERATALTRQMLAYSGRGHFVVEAVDLHGLIQESLILSRAAMGSNAGVELDLNCRQPVIEADRAQIQQVVMNILINASESFGDAPGQVVVRTALSERREPWFSNRLHARVPAGRYVLLEICDNGPGMQPEMLKKIFDPFFTTKFTGRGLGLAAVLGIVKGHQGDIEVESQQGKGTAFRILLPTSVRRSSKDNQSPNIPAATTGQTILVVDDEEIVLRTATATLESRGYRVLRANNGIEALEVLRKEPGVALVILDLTMPVMTGEQAFPLIKELNPKIPVMLSSGFSETEMSERFAGFDVAGILEKPYSVATIVAKVGELLRKG